MEFAKGLLASPITIAWGIVNGLLSIAGYLGIPESLSPTERVLSIGCAALLITLLALIVRSYQMLRNIRTPVEIKSVVNGSHHYKGTIVLILNKLNWIEPGQILVLMQLEANDVQTPLALIEVQTFTTKKFPQCILVKSLTDENLETYLADSSRWKSMIVLPDIKMSFLEGPKNG